MSDTSFIFIEKGIEVCFSDKKKIVLDYKIEKEIEKYIWETGNPIYYRITRRKGIGWFDRNFTKVPTSIGYKL